MKAYLILEDGNVFTGTSIGAARDLISKIVFNTSMTGYLEALTDPSNAGQVVVMTYPLVGNYGICYEDMESCKPWVDGYIVREIARCPSNFRSEVSIETYLKENDIPGIEAIDTRALTKLLRDKGSMNCMITTNENINIEETIQRLKNHKSTNLVGEVTRKEKITLSAKEYSSLEKDLGESYTKTHPYKKGNFKVAIVDFGLMNSITDCLLKRGCEVTIYSAFTKAEDVIMDNPDGIILTGGPGDPKDYIEITNEVKKLYESNIPIFAIGLGHQLMALANGANTKNLLCGHRGSNYPVKDLKTGRVYISSQNHGYVVDNESMNERLAEVSFINANDGTVEGYHYLCKNIFSVQFDPKVSAGPQESEFLFDEFMNMMEVSK